MNDHGADAVERRPRIAQLWQQHRARWTLPLVIIVIIAAVAIVDHLDSHRISQVDEQNTSVLVPATGGAVTVGLRPPVGRVQPQHPGRGGFHQPDAAVGSTAQRLRDQPAAGAAEEQRSFVGRGGHIDVAVDHPVR